jgi:hypothetical protein
LDLGGSKDLAVKEALDLSLIRFQLDDHFPDGNMSSFYVSGVSDRVVTKRKTGCAKKFDR